MADPTQQALSDLHRLVRKTYLDGHEEGLRQGVDLCCTAVEAVLAAHGDAPLTADVIRAALRGVKEAQDERTSQKPSQSETKGGRYER